MIRKELIYRQNVMSMTLRFMTINRHKQHSSIDPLTTFFIAISLK